MENTLAIHPQTQPLTAFGSLQGFEAAQRMAKLLCSSDLVPDAFRGAEKLGSALIALEMSQRIGASPLAVMQNLHVIHGRPSWSSSFIIAALNTCGRFSPLRFRVIGEGDNRSCVAWAVEKATGETLEGPESSIAMAKAEGWYSKNGSKWRTMPDLMLRYRAAAFFGRLYAPDVLNGMHAVEEVEDAGVINVTPLAVKSSAVEALNASLQPAPDLPTAPAPKAPEEPSEPAQEVIPPPAPRTRRRASAPAPVEDAELLPSPTKTAESPEAPTEEKNGDEWA